MRQYVVHEVIQRTLITNPDQLVISSNTRLTYAQLYGRVLRFIVRLRGIINYEDILLNWRVV